MISFSDTVAENGSFIYKAMVVLTSIYTRTFLEANILNTQEKAYLISARIMYAGKNKSKDTQ